ncbi:MAG: hypothetical protein QG673_24 [Pseudomonadota bacterium]|nr:hypothetical protein [Pseudomonadota bacterium]
MSVFNNKNNSQDKSALTQQDKNSEHGKSEVKEPVTTDINKPKAHEEKTHDNHHQAKPDLESNKAAVTDPVHHNKDSVTKQ